MVANTSAKMADAVAGYDALLAADQSLLDAMPVALCVCSANGIVRRYNRRATRLWMRAPHAGETEERYCGSFRLYDLDGAPLPHDAGPMEAALRTGKEQADRKIVIGRPDGSRITVLANIRPLTGPASEVLGAINMFVDISGEQEARRKEAQFDAQRLASIVETSQDAIITKDLSGRITSWNQGAERIFGYGAAEIVGRPVTTLFPDALLDEENAILDRIRRGERVGHYETVRKHKDGSLVDISLAISPLKDPEGRIVGASKIARDVSGRKHAEQALARRMAEQAALYRMTDRLYHGASLADAFEAALDAIMAALGCSRASILLFDRDEVMRFVAWRGLSDAYRRAVDGHSPWTADTREAAPIYMPNVAEGGLEPDLRARIEAENIGALAFIPLFGDGRVTGKFMAYYDRPHVFSREEDAIAVTIARQLGFTVQRFHAEAQREMLIAELSHRVKNTLATVISIARQSFNTGSDAREAHASFEARIRALGQTHGRLAEAHWAGVLLGTMLADELAPYRDGHSGNVRLDGPDVSLPPKIALSLGMAFHELATNAAKYGAFSHEHGHVAVAWALEGGTLRIAWTESGGPRVVAPARMGFGRILLEKVLAHDLNGTVEIDYARDGLRCAFAIPWDGDARTSATETYDRTPAHGARG